MDDRAAARVLDVDDERAIALARALVGADDEEHGLFDTAAISANVREIGGFDEGRDDEIVI